MPLDDNTNFRRKKGVKIDNENSSVKVPIDTKKQFEDRANDAFAEIEGWKKRTVELTLKYKAMLEDKMLQVNKGPLAKEIENDIMNKLIVLAAEMDTNINQDDCAGSELLCMLLLKMNLVQRDIINNLAYKVEQIEKALEKK